MHLCMHAVALNIQFTFTSVLAVIFALFSLCNTTVYLVSEDPIESIVPPLVHVLCFAVSSCSEQSLKIFAVFIFKVVKCVLPLFY